MMLLLYVRLVRQVLTPLEWDIKPNQHNLNPSETEQKSPDSDRLTQTQVSDRLRHHRQVYYLERRFLL